MTLVESWNYKALFLEMLAKDQKIAIQKIYVSNIFQNEVYYLDLLGSFFIRFKKTIKL